jgi:hypothetical protein
LKIVFYTSGITGSGRIIKGISIGNALRRKNINAEYTILHHSDFVVPWNYFQFTKIPLEEDNRHSARNFSSSVLYKTLNDLQPDILLVDLLWFPFRHFISELHCKKIFLFRQVDDNFFSLQHPEGSISLNQKSYDAVIAIEPFNSIIQMTSINPIIIRNRGEIKSKDEARKNLKIPDESGKCGLLYFNGNPGDFEKVKNAYSYLEKEGYQMVYSTNYNDGIFPVADYFNAFDMIICGAGYNSYWEAVYFNKETIFIPTFARFESGERRITECQEYYFEENGADQLVDIIMGM